MYRYMTIIRRRLHARSLPNQRTEAKIACHVLNQMTSIGMPATVGSSNTQPAIERSGTGLFVRQSAFSRLAQHSLASRPSHSHGPISDRYPKASDTSSPPCLVRLLPAGAGAGRGLHRWRSAAFSRRTWEVFRPSASTENDVKEILRKDRARQPQACGRPAALSRRSINNEGWFEGDRPGHVVEVG